MCRHTNVYEGLSYLTKIWRPGRGTGWDARGREEVCVRKRQRHLLPSRIFRVTWRDSHYRFVLTSLSLVILKLVAQILRLLRRQMDSTWRLILVGMGFLELRLESQAPRWIWRTAMNLRSEEHYRWNSDEAFNSLVILSWNMGKDSCSR